MPFEVVSADPGVQYEVDSTDTVTLTAGTVFTSATDGFDATADAGLLFSGVDLRIFGSIYSGNRAVDFWGSLGTYDGYSNNNILVGTTGVVSGVAHGIITEGGANNSIVNFGTIIADIAIETDGGANYNIQNSGTVTSLAGSGIAVGGDIDTAGGLNTSVMNLAGGTISGFGVGGAGILLEDDVGGSQIRNYGLIQSSSDYGVNLTNTNNGQGVISVFNFGTISGGTGAYLGSLNADTVVNRGVLLGDVVLNSGADTFDGRGSGHVVGAVYGGLGDDSLFGSSAADEFYGGDDVDDLRGNNGDDVLNGDLGDDVIYGGNDEDTLNGDVGNDSLFGGNGDDELNGGDGDDRMLGNGGSDSLFGGIGVDTLFGLDGDDQLVGSSGNDSIFGGRGDDTLDGGNDADRINGGDGNDQIEGGAGVDLLFGNAGADTFVFRDTTDSGVATGTRDRIFDFDVAEDIISLSAIDANSVLAGNQVFVFIDEAAFSNVSGQLRYQQSTGQLQGDVNGDGIADFAIELTTRPDITVANLLL